MSLSPLSLPDLSTRLEAEEWMDDVSITDERLTRALADLRWTNWLLGGYRATTVVLDPLLRRRDEVRLLDLGCGGGDHLVHLVRRGAQLDCVVEGVGLDRNPVTVGHARTHLNQHLPSPLRSRVRVEIGDALALPHEDDAFDVVHAALFLHHFHGEEATRIVNEMQRIGRLGLLINDLHRHLVAYLGIWLLSRTFRMAPMVQHDGPVSVRRGFRREDFDVLAQRAGLPSPSIRWHWAFRWTLSTIVDGE